MLNLTTVTKTLALSLTMLTALSSHKVIAWGQNGHRVIGEIADMHLTDSTKSALQPLLAGSSLAQISTWPDEMRSNPEHFWRKESGKWHYINIKDAKKMHQYVNTSIDSRDKVAHILDGIYYSINILKSNKSDLESRKFALSFLVHLVGDSHQPFHAGRSEDRGGNLIKVSFFGKETNLHSTWDTHLIENENLSFTEFADFIKTSNKKTIKAYLNSQPADWLVESNKISHRVYGENETKLSYGYVYKHMPVVKKRLSQGGIRLAGLLNQIFDSNAKPLTEALIKKRS
ncbi:S1/P1 Nuclease [Pseudoalteromonas phenolica]|uniref:S1/P1 Nuclease n=1 Tax=Pseudoalteromonas phenolica TaxID=161398 RepID=A0A5R9Q551_9GAMM|nr:S1/P1 Nuclease [Pseudoalteromonas phenolica]